jgi:FtsP/CotA-like multicopper oxidase with cupredoxin domain
MAPTQSINDLNTNNRGLDVSDHPNRRRFLKGAAAAAAMSALPPAAQAGDPPATPTSTQAMNDLIRARFGKHLNEGQLKRAQAEVAGVLRSAEIIKAVNLELAEEPAMVFVAEPEA